MGNLIGNLVGNLVGGWIAAAVPGSGDPRTRSASGAEQAIAVMQARLGAAVAARHRAQVQREEVRRKHQSLGERAVTAVQAGRDDVAVGAIAVQIDLEAEMAILDDTIAAAAEQVRVHEQALAALQALRSPAERVTSDPGSPLVELNALDRSRRIADRLAALKAELAEGMGSP